MILASLALAQVPPPFGPGAFSGFALPTPAKHRWTPLGAVARVVSDPTAGELLVGANLWLQHVAVGASLPVTWTDALRLGDATVAARFTPFAGRRGDLGVRAGLAVPSLAPSLGIGADARAGDLLVACDLGWAGGTSWTWASGVRLSLPEVTRLKLTGQLLLRGSLADRAPSAAQALGGAELRFSPRNLVGVEVRADLARGGSWITTVRLDLEDRGFPSEEVYVPPLRENAVPYRVRDAVRRGVPTSFEVDVRFSRTSARLRGGRRNLNDVADLLMGAPSAVVALLGPDGDAAGLPAERARVVCQYLVDRGVGVRQVVCEDDGNAVSGRVRFRVLAVEARR